MDREAGVPAEAHVRIHSVAAQGDPLDRALARQLPHQLEPAAVGQADVADQKVEPLRFRELEGRFHGPHRPHTVVESLENMGEHLGSVLMILDHKDAHRLRGAFLRLFPGRAVAHTLLFDDRQLGSERRPFASPAALDAEAATVGLDDGVRDRQAESQTP